MKFEVFTERSLTSFVVIVLIVEIVYRYGTNTLKIN